jgi:hypothetical protein
MVRRCYAHHGQFRGQLFAWKQPSTWSSSAALGVLGPPAVMTALAHPACKQAETE